MSQVTRWRPRPIPSRPIQVIVPFPPGGVADLVGRPFATALEKQLKQPVVIVNKTGAGGAVGMQAQAVSKPDGYTLMVALSSISVMPEVDALFGRPPVYKLSDFAPIALLSADPTVLVVSSKAPWKTVADFVADAKKRPGEIKYASSGVYGTMHVAMEMFAHSSGDQAAPYPHGRRRAGPDGAVGRPCGRHLRRAERLHPAGQGGRRQDPGGLGGQTPFRAAGRPDVERARLQGCGILHLVGVLRPGGHARSR